MSIVSNITYLFRSYSSILGYMNAKDKYERKVKLTNKSYASLSKRVHNSFATLHAEKREYREEVTKIEDELKEIKAKMLESQDNLEKAKLKMEYNKKKIEHEVKIKLLPRKLKKVKKKMGKFIQKSRENAIKTESRRPIMISEDLENRALNIINMLAPALGEEAVVTEIGQDNLAVAANLSTGENLVNNTGIQEEFQAAMAAAEDNELSNVGTSKSNPVGVDSFVSDFVDKQMKLTGLNEHSEVTAEDDSIGQNVSDLMSGSGIENQHGQGNIDPLFGVKDMAGQYRSEVEIPQPRVAEAPTEVEFHQPRFAEAPAEALSDEQSLGTEDKKDEYIEKCNDLQEEFEQAKNKGDKEELERIKEELVETVNKIKETEKNKDTSLKQAQDDALAAVEENNQVKDAARTEVLASEITSLMSDVYNSIKNIKSIEEQTAATLASTEKLNSSTKAIKSLLAQPTGDNIAELNAMLSAADAADSKVTAKGNNK